MSDFDKYLEKFGEAFPMIPMAWGRTQKEISDIIKECLEKNKTVYDLGYVTNDEEVIY